MNTAEERHPDRRTAREKLKARGLDYTALGRALAEYYDDKRSPPLPDLMRRLMREMARAERTH
jgi:hypothetical protein